MSAIESQTRILQNLVTRGYVTRTDAAKKMQVIASSGVGDATAEHFEPFGLTAHPVNGAETIAVQVGGTGHPVVLSVADRRYRPTGLAAGEVCLYDAFGHEVRMQSAGAVANCLMDAIGFKAGGVAGLTGTLVLAATPPLPAPPVPVPVLTVAFAGGIVTSVVPGAPWTVAVGSVFQATWS